MSDQLLETKTPASEIALHYQLSSHNVVAGQDSVMRLEFGTSQPTEKSEEEGITKDSTSEWISIPNPTGIHARPAATLAAKAKTFKSRIQLERDGQTADAKSVVALMGLNIKLGEEVRFIAQGNDAEDAVEALTEAICEGLGEDVSAVASTPTQEPLHEEVSLLAKISSDPSTLLGIAASPGVAIGRVHQLKQQEFSFDELAGESNTELAALTNAIQRAKSDLKELQSKLQAEGNISNAEIFAAHRELLEDPTIFLEAEKQMNQGKSAANAWHRAVSSQIRVLQAVDSDVIAGRVADLEDVCTRVLKLLLGVTGTDTELPENTIIIAEDLTPSDTANLDRSKVIGFVTTLGGATSHAAILARSMKLPAIAGVDDQVLSLEQGRKIVLDGEAGTLNIAPSDEQVAQLRQKQKVLLERQQSAQAKAHQPAVTKDGHAIEVVANIGNIRDAREAMQYGAEGVGLLRSEFLYLDQTIEPDEEQQAQVYSEIANTLGSDQPLIIRTLDVGGDKPLPYLPLPAEENPFLGERGIRIGLNRPSLLRRQVRAILRAHGHAKLKIMFPMIATLPELRAAKQLVKEEATDLGVEGVEVGIMVEVPSTAVLSELFAAEVDFFSIGTNDLTQYTLAMDRGHPKLGWQVDALDPAVLRLIQLTIEGASKHGKWVGVCGGAASDLLAVPVLIGLGITELSCSVPAIPEVKEIVRSMSLEKCQQLAEQVLKQPDADSVRNFLQSQGC